MVFVKSECTSHDLTQHPHERLLPVCITTSNRSLRSADVESFQIKWDTTDGVSTFLKSHVSVLPVADEETAFVPAILNVSAPPSF